MKIVIVWFDERRQEIGRTPEMEPGDQSRLAIPLEAEHAQVIMIIPEEAWARSTTSNSGG